ncbi:LptF/LptG family permease [Hoeflea sp.]|uniref:LptF/LptG family permease n=1 Tax=Hoeflea sp. TaxID=1940281 RepID=UPI003B518DA2
MSDISKEFLRHDFGSRQTPGGLIKSITRAFLRLETRLVTILYLQRVTILALVTVSIIVALDVSANVDGLLSSTEQAEASQDLGRIVYYALLRVSFVTPSVLLFAGVWGVVWAEYTLATSNERFMLFNCGRSYIPSLVPALVVGILVGLLHFAVSGYLKPWTVELEATTTHRSYGLKFERPVQSGERWFAGTDFIARARVEIGDEIRLHDVYVFDYGENRDLQFIIRAASAEPARDPGRWTFRSGTVSYFSTLSGTADNNRPALEQNRFDALETDLALSPLWVENIGILPILLPQPLLAELLEQGELVPNLYKYEMTVYERYASILYCLVTVLLTAHLSMTRFSSDRMPYRALSVALVGFGAYFFFSVTLMLGHHGYSPTLFAAWAIPLAAVAVLSATIYSYVAGTSGKPSG